jgi:adenine-specific DNA-methyltransferase
MLKQGTAVEKVLDDVVDVVRAAVSLGAVERGGELSLREVQLVKRAQARSPLTRAERERFVEQILRGDDPLGDALTRVRSRDQRRAMGSFYTPPKIVAPMVAWALAYDPAIVVDPGCGSGRFAAAVARLSPDAQLLAIDKDAAATLVTRAVLAQLKPRRTRVVNADFLALTTIHRTPRRRVAWLGNPPFVRHQLFSRTLKIRGVALAARAGHASLMTAGLHALFFSQTRLLAEPGDIGCYVTPSEWVDNKSGGIVRDLFMNGLGGESVLLLDPDTFAFAGVKTTAAITSFVVGKESAIRRLAINVPVAALADGIETLGRILPCTALTTSRGWSRVVNNPTGMPDTCPTIGDLFHVHRGTATGANSFWMMTKEDAKARGLTKYGVPTITRAADIINAGGILKQRSDTKVMIFLPKTIDRAADRAVDKFIRRGERPDATGLVVSDGSNAQKRTKPWWSIVLSRPMIVATYMARRPPTFAANPDRLGILNIAIGLEPKFAMDAATVTTVVNALNAASGGFEEYAVRYFGNLRKFEPRTVALLPLPESIYHLLHPAIRE